MKRIAIARFAGIAAGAAMVLGVAAPAGAQTIAQLQAQIAALMAQLQALQGGSASAAITSDLTVGSTGSQVVALQNALVAQGYLTMPAGVAPGYFGALTKAAVMKWQAANGVSATGYFGPLSRAKWGSTGTTGGSTTGGTTVGGTAGGVISTPGAEGTLTVTSAPVSNATLYEGQSMKTILAFKAEASGSDLAVQRVKVDLTTDADVYRKVLSKIYFVDDAGKTLASADLNSSTVVKNSSNEYEITLTGFSSVVSKGATRTYEIKADVREVIEAADLTSYTFALSENGVRAIDGAGIDLYSPTADTDVTKAITFSASLVESASLTVSTNASNPLDRELVAAGGSNDNEADKVVLMVFDIKADKDDVTITDMINFAVTRSAGAATASTTYLYVGNGTGGQLLGSAAVSGSDADFSDISVTIPAGTTKTFTLAADIRAADSTQTTVDVTWTVDTTNLVAENSQGDSVSVSGSVSANNLLVRNVGPEITLGSHTLTRDPGTSGVANGTSTASATFNLTIKAVGGDIWFGTQSASSTFGFGIHSNGANAATVLTASSTSWAVPSGVVTSGLATGQAFKLSEGQTVTIPVTFLFEGRLATGALVPTASYAVGLSSIIWSDSQLGAQESSTFMANKTEWRSNAVTMP